MFPSVSTPIVDFVPALIKSRLPLPENPLIEISRVENLESAKQVFNELAYAGRQFFIENKSTLYKWAAIVSAIIFLLSVIFLWIYSRLKLVLLKSLVSRQVLLKSWWRDTREGGNSFFRWNIFLLGFLWLFVTLVIGGAIYGFLANIIILEVHGLQLLLGGITFLAVSIIWAGFLWFFHELVPIVMVQTGRSPGAALRLFWPTRFINVFSGLLVVFFYALFAFGLSMLAGLLLVIGGLLALLLSAAIVLAGVFIMKLFGSVIGVIFFTLAGLLIFLMMAALAFIFLVPVETFLYYLKIEIVKPMLTL